MARNRKRNRQRKKEREMAARPNAMPEDMMAGQGMMARKGESEQPTGDEASPEEQALYHKFMENYYTIMYIGGGDNQKQPPLADDILNEFFSGDLEPVEALANAGMSVVNSLSQSASQAGKPIPGDVLMHAGIEVLEDIAELAENKNFHEYNQEELDGALYRAMDLYRDINAQSLNKEEIEADYAAISQADKEGRLDEVLPGVSDASEKMPQPPMANEQQAPQVPPNAGMMRRT